MPRPGITPPMVEAMADLPVVSAAGCCLVGMFDAATRTNLYIYGLFPTSAIAATFWRYSVLSNTWLQLASPTFAATDLLTTACAMVAEPSSGSVFLFNSRNDTVTPQYHNFQQYSPFMGGTWTTLAPAAPNDLETVAALVAPWAGDAAMCHPCTTVGVPASNDFIYLTGNASTGMFIYDTMNNTWAMNAGIARGGAVGTGVGAAWFPETPDIIYSPRGGTSDQIDGYEIAAGNFSTNTTQLPLPFSYTLGMESVADVHRMKLVTQMGGRMYEAQVERSFAGSSIIQTQVPLGTMYRSDGAVHKGNGLVSIRIGGQSYVYWRKHTRTEFQRLEVLE